MARRAVKATKTDENETVFPDPGAGMPDIGVTGAEPVAGTGDAAVSMQGQEKELPLDWNEEARRHPTLLIRRTLRSGQSVRFRGNVVVLGDVNPGAEITAGGDIVVMGWLRGMAHAGAQGNLRAIVSAFRLNPTQLRIAQYIARAPDQGETALPQVPEYAEVRDGQLVIDSWQASILSSPQIRGS